MASPAPVDVAGLVDRLRDVLGAAAVLTGADMAGNLTDWRGVHETDAIAVARPADTTQVAAVVQVVSKAGASIVTQGGNTGLSGGAAPDPATPSVVIDLRRMDRIESVDPYRWTLTAQAGATIEAIQAAASAHGRLFGPDWGARGSATIGGGIATDAGGNNVLRYGNMRDQVLGLEVVLPDGQVWDGLRALRKDSSGYDLKQLFIGSEGTLGIITKAVVTLHSPTPHVQSGFAALRALDDLPAVYELAREVAPDVVTAFELIPRAGLDRVCEVHGVARPLGDDADFFVLIRLGAAEPVADTLAALFERMTQARLIGNAVIAGTPDQEARLWTIRDELPPIGLYPETQGFGLKMDIAVPIDRIQALHDGVMDIRAALVPDAIAYGFGHVGDGNLHMMVLPASPADTPEFLERKPELVARIDALTFSLGGDAQRRTRRRAGATRARRGPEICSGVGADAHDQGCHRPQRRHEPQRPLA